MAGWLPHHARHAAGYSLRMAPTLFRTVEAHWREALARRRMGMVGWDMPAVRATYPPGTEQRRRQLGESRQEELQLPQVD